MNTLKIPATVSKLTKQYRPSEGEVINDLIIEPRQTPLIITEDAFKACSVGKKGM